MTWDSMKYGSVQRMLDSLDRAEIEAAKDRRYRNMMRRLNSGERRFVRVLRHVLEDVKGPENLQREKIMKRLKIGLRMHQKLLAAVRENLV